MASLPTIMGLAGSRSRRKKSRGPKGQKCLRYKQTRKGRRCAKYGRKK